MHPARLFPQCGPVFQREIFVGSETHSITTMAANQMAPQPPRAHPVCALWRGRAVARTALWVSGGRLPCAVVRKPARPGGTAAPGVLSATPTCPAECRCPGNGSQPCCRRAMASTGVNRHGRGRTATPTGAGVRPHGVHPGSPQAPTRYPPAGGPHGFGRPRGGAVPRLSRCSRNMGPASARIKCQPSPTHPCHTVPCHAQPNRAQPNHAWADAEASAFLLHID